MSENNFFSLPVRFLSAYPESTMVWYNVLSLLKISQNCVLHILDYPAVSNLITDLVVSPSGSQTPLLLCFDEIGQMRIYQISSETVSVSSSFCYSSYLPHEI